MRAEEDFPVVVVRGEEDCPGVSGLHMGSESNIGHGKWTSHFKIASSE